MSESHGAVGVKARASTRGWAATACLMAAALAPALLLFATSTPWPWLPALLGRAHPMILHFPIALLLLVVAMEAIEVVTRGRTRCAQGLVLFFGTFGAVLAAACGYLLM